MLERIRESWAAFALPPRRVLETIDVIAADAFIQDYSAAEFVSLEKCTGREG